MYPIFLCLVYKTHGTSIYALVLNSWQVYEWMRGTCFRMNFFILQFIIVDPKLKMNRIKYTIIDQLFVYFFYLKASYLCQIPGSFQTHYDIYIIRDHPDSLFSWCEFPISKCERLMINNIWWLDVWGEDGGWDQRSWRPGHRCLQGLRWGGWVQRKEDIERAK